MPLTWLEPLSYVLEDLHTRLNLVRSHLAHTGKLAEQVGVDLDAAVERAMGMKRPTLGWEGHQFGELLKRRGQWLQGLSRHPQYAAIKHRWDLIVALVTLTHTPLPTDRQIEHFGVLAERFGALLKLHWGKDSRVPYHFGFYDHGVICHAPEQLRTCKSLFKYSTWFLEHMNKWWKRFISMHSTHGGGAGTPESRDITAQCLKRFVLLTHPAVRGRVEAVLARRRGVYHCHGCGQEKYLGHTRTCRWARKLKLLNKERKQAGQPALMKLPDELCYPNDPGVL